MKGGQESLTITRWESLRDEQREAAARSIAEAYDGGLEYLGLRRVPRAKWTIAELAHRRSGLSFNLVPGGTFTMGAGAAAEALVGFEFEDAGPPHEVTVPSFLLARTPMTVAQVRRWIPDFEDEFDGTDHYGTRLSDDEAVTSLEAARLRLPTEAEWEYACRSGTTSLTYRGDDIPDSGRMLVDEFTADAEDDHCVNSFGLVGLGGFPEVCADSWQDGYAGAPSDGSALLGGPNRACRGGAIDLAPWQDCKEWFWLLSAARGNSDDGAALGVALRPALSLTPRATAMALAQLRAHWP